MENKYIIPDFREIPIEITGKFRGNVSLIVIELE
jgi:hypothetical protein